MIGHEPDPPGPTGQINDPHELLVPPGPGNLPALPPTRTPGTLLAPAPTGPFGIAMATSSGPHGLADLPAPFPNLTIGGPGAPTDLPASRPDPPGLLTRP
ncbi:hypothetical protein [Streptomyces canus]|uniref:hypothetical protein n=1 Tax=Streptomyces canus TaxID=58343 RepID=UPI003714040B